MQIVHKLFIRKVCTSRRMHETLLFRRAGFSGRAHYKNVPTSALIINNPHVIIHEHVHLKLRRAGRA
jgi:hypothetical protein